LLRTAFRTIGRYRSIDGPDIVADDSRVPFTQNAPRTAQRVTTVDLRRLIVIARAWLPLMVVAALVAGAAAFVVSNLQQKVYEAKATLIVGQALSATNPDYSQLLVAQNLSATYAAVAKTRPILESVVAELGLKVDPDELAKHIEVSAPRDSTFLMITAQDPAPARAADIANALARQLIASAPTIQGRAAEFQKSIDQDLAATQDLIGTSQARADALLEIKDRTKEQEAELQALEGRLASLRSTYATLLSFSSPSATNLLTVVEPAEAPTAFVLPRTLLNTLLAAAIGLLVVVGIAFLVEQLDDSIKDPGAVQEVAGLSTLATIARIRSARGQRKIYLLVGILYPRSGTAEAYRTLRTNVEFASVDAPLHTLLVTSASPGEGKTITAANLAVVFAQAGRAVLLVDADLRKPAVHEMFDLPNSRGLTTMLRDDMVGLDTVAHSTEQANLRILTTGPLPPNPAELLGSQRMQAVLENLLRSADLVIFDSPPLQAVTDAAVLSSFTDGTLLVIDAGRSRRRVVRMAMESLTRAGANSIGAVLNRVPARAQHAYGGYYGAAPGSADVTTPGADVPGVAPERPGPSVDVPGPS
jgi:capsular exopolysaccharide synthesis family protein